MSLYLCVYSDDANDLEIDGIEMGPYPTFGFFRKTVCDRLEGGEFGSLFPHLQRHSDCEGEWAVDGLSELEVELQAIQKSMIGLPSPTNGNTWLDSIHRELGREPTNLSEYFVDTDGAPLLGRLIDLVRLAKGAARPISFQ
jgi:hypothetical protein